MWAEREGEISAHTKSPLTAPAPSYFATPSHRSRDFRSALLRFPLRFGGLLMLSWGTANVFYKFVCSQFSLFAFIVCVFLTLIPKLRTSCCINCLCLYEPVMLSTVPCLHWRYLSVSALLWYLTVVAIIISVLLLTALYSVLKLWISK